MHEIDTRPGAGSLSQAYSRWLHRGDDRELISITEKVITVAVMGAGPSAQSADARQFARLAVWRALGRVEDPDNKRLYNYLYHTARLAVRDWQRKHASRERKAKVIPVGLEPLRAVCTQPDTLLPDFDDPDRNAVARLLSEGHTLKHIRSELGLSARAVRNHMEVMRRYYLNQG